VAFFDLGSAKQKSEVKDYYDILIIGGGPGGITAGIYAVQADRKSVV